MQKKIGLNYFVIHRFDVSHSGFKAFELHNFMRTDQSTKNIVQRSFSLKLLKLWNNTNGEPFTSGPI